jgi:hypothetical protein
MPDATHETWKPVVGYEGLYEVSDRGRVRTVPRILKPGTLNHGHLHVNLWINRKGKTRTVHRLVAAAFIGPCPDGQEVRHLDGNPTNNAVENLKYGTRSENLLDRVRHGTHNNASKTHCKNGHEFTPENTIDNHGNRGCRECHRVASLAWWDRQRSKEIK